MNCRRPRPVLLQVLTACCLWGCTDPKPVAVQPRLVRTVEARFELTQTTSRYSGEVKARHEPSLAFRVPGKLLKRLVDVGTVVQKGQLLAVLDPVDFQLNQTTATAQWQSAQAQLALAREDLTHSSNLLEKNLTSPATHEHRVEAMRIAEAQAETAKAHLSLSMRQSEYTELRADFAGVITAVDAEPGQVLASGQPLLRMANPQENEVVVNVPENRLDDLRSADTLKISLWAEPNRLHEAKVREISPGVDALIRTFTVKLSVPDHDDAIKMGMTATVHVLRTDTRPAAWLPLTALTRIDNQDVVWVFDPAQHSVHAQAVTVSAYGEASAKILDGIKTGDQVVSAGVHKLLPGEQVRRLEDTP